MKRVPTDNSERWRSPVDCSILIYVIAAIRTEVLYYYY